MRFFIKLPFQIYLFMLKYNLELILTAEYKEELLKNMGVYELRELARQVGVSSPTTKKRKQLEQEILKIAKGESNPQIKKSQKGRPPKSIKKVENVLDVFVPKQLLEITFNKKVDNEIKQLLKLCSNSIDDDELYNVCGFVKRTVSGYYYFKMFGINEECVSIPNDIIEKYSLQEGDKICGTATKFQQENFYFLKKIEHVNGHAPILNRNLADIQQVILKDIPIKNLNGINEGNNVLFINDNFKNGISQIKELIKPIENDYSIVIYAPNISVYHKLFIEKDLQGDVIYSLVDDHPAVTYESSINAINYVNMLLKEGKKVIFIMLDLFGLLNGIEIFFALENQRQSYQENIEASRIVKKMFNNGKVLENNASLTILATCMMHETDDVFYKNELIKTADKVLKI